MSILTHINHLIISNNISIANSEMPDHPEYVEFMRRVVPEVRREIERKMAALKNPDRLVASLLKAISKKWGMDDTVIADPDMPYIALLAFKERKISRTQLGTLLHFWGAIQCHKEQGGGDFKPETFDFFNADGSVNQKAFELLKETFSSPFTESAPGAYAAITLTTEEEERLFIEEMRKLPRSEQQFSKILAPSDIFINFILVALREVSGFPAFGFVNGGDVILETMGMAQAFINATRRGSESSVQMNIVIGLSSDEDIEKNGLTGTRDVAVHFPGVELPRMADGQRAEWIYFTKHDIFHAKAQDIIGAPWTLKIVNTWRGLPFLGTEQEQRVQERTKQIFNDLDAAGFRHCFLSKGAAFWEHFVTSFIFPTVERDPNAFFNRQVTLLSAETEDAVLRQLFARLVEKDSEIAKGPEEEFSASKEQLARWMPSSFLNRFFESRIVRKIPRIWREQKGINPTFLEKFKRNLLAEENETRRDEIVKEATPFLSSKNILGLLKFATEEENRAKCAPLAKACRYFISLHFSQVVKEDAFKQLQKESPKFAESILLSFFDDEDFEGYFIELLKAKDREILDLLCSVALNRLDHRGHTMLDYAVWEQNIDAVKQLLENGANPNPIEGSKSKKPTAFVAIDKANLELYKLLLEKGFDKTLEHQGKNSLDYLIHLGVTDENRFGGIVRKWGGQIKEEMNGADHFILTTIIRSNKAHYERAKRQEPVEADKVDLNYLFWAVKTAAMALDF